MKKLRVFEAFAGYGSQKMALRNKRINHEVVAISEIDEFAITAYEAIHGKANNLGDISALTVDQIPDFDLLTYSFPCTDISLAGKQQGLGKGETRSGLLWECERIVESKKPKYLMMENVKNLVGKKFIGDFNAWCKWLEGQGYTNYWKVINATDVNVPQGRQRVFMISILGEHTPFKFPEPIECTKTLGDILLDDCDVDAKYYIPLDRIVKINNWKSYQNPFDRLIGRKSICPTLTARGAGEYHSGAIILGTNSYNINVREVIRQNPFFVENMYKPRFLTPIESFRAMGVKDEDFNKIRDIIPERQLYKLAGNSIVVDVLESIFEELFKDYIIE